MKLYPTHLLSSISGGATSLTSAPGGGMQIKVTGTSTTNLNGVLFTSTELLIGGISHPEAFEPAGYKKDTNTTIYGSPIEGGSVYIIR